MNSRTSKTTSRLALTLSLTLAVVLGATLGATPATVYAQQGDALVQGAVQGMESAAGAPVEMTKSPVTGLATWIAAAPDQSIPTFAPRTASAEARGRLFLDSYGSAFGISSRDQVQADRVLGPDDTGLEHVRFRQVHNGVPVRGGEIVVDLRQAEVSAVAANTLPNLDAVATTPTVMPQEAVSAARAILATHLNVTDATFSAPQLEIFNRGLFDGTPSPTRLVWFIEATGADLREFLWVDAEIGTVLLHLDQLAEASDNRPYDDLGDTYHYFTKSAVALAGGSSLTAHAINGPPIPPPGFTLERMAVALPQPNPAAGVATLTVPAFNWSFGCSATSGAMIAAYYDRNGLPNMYTGPTNGGVMPLNSGVWPKWIDGVGKSYGQCPLTASHQGLDGRASRGSMDDYWVSYGSAANDPYITHGWSQHTWGAAIGDYMKTSQYAYGNTDGSTTFWNWTSKPDQLTCAEMPSYGITNDGTDGRKLFYEAKGYTVTSCYNQKTDNTVSGGFSFAMYQAEINAGRPVFLNLAGHSIVGVGYNTVGNIVYVHDTWDYLTHTMTWGGSYSGMQLLSVSIVVTQQPVSIHTTTTVASSANPATAGQSITLTATVTPAEATGTVTFKDGATTLGTGTLSGGTAIFNTAALTLGVHSITAALTAPNFPYKPSAFSPPLVQTVTKVPTATTVSSSLNPSTFGHSVTFTATVTPAGATGTVTFKNGAAILGTRTLSGGTAVFSSAALTVGPHSITAVLTGTGSYAGSTSPALVQTVGKASTTTTVVSSLNPATARQVVRFTATVTPAAATGTVTFKDGATTLGTGIRVGGLAIFFTTTLTVGTHDVTAVFNATGAYTGSTSAPLTQTIKGNTVTTLATDRTPAIFGQMVTFTARVTPSTLTGAVTFKDGATILGTGTLSAGIASFSTAELEVGTHSITAVTAGNGLYNPSTSMSLVQTVRKVPTTTTVGSSLNPSTFGVAVTFTARVTPAGATGTVTFKDGAAILGTRTLSGGTATFSSAALAVGSHSITAVFTGTGVYASSTSPALIQRVNKAPTTTTLTSSLNPSTAGQAVTFTATVSPTAATGTVIFTKTFMGATTILHTSPLVAGVATYTTTALRGNRSHCIKAVLIATGNYSGSTSNMVVQTVY